MYSDSFSTIVIVAAFITLAYWIAMLAILASINKKMKMLLLPDAKSVDPNETSKEKMAKFYSTFGWQYNKDGCLYLVCTNPQWVFIKQEDSDPKEVHAGDDMEPSFTFSDEYGNIRVTAPIDGIASWCPSSKNGDINFTYLQKVIKIDPTSEGLLEYNRWLEAHNDIAKKRAAESLSIEKEKIALKLIKEQKEKAEKRRMAELEEQVRKELIEKGQLPPETK